MDSVAATSQLFTKVQVKRNVTPVTSVDVVVTEFARQANNVVVSFGLLLVMKWL